VRWLAVNADSLFWSMSEVELHSRHVLDMVCADKLSLLIFCTNSMGNSVI
jgi:hypothetical protein